MKRLVCMLSILTCLTIRAEGNRLVPKAPRLGSFIILPAKGRIALLNSQIKIPADKIKARASLLSDILTAEMDVIQCPSFSLKEAKNARLQNGVDVAFFIIDDNDYPMSLVALEERWAMINLAQISDGNPDEKVILRRFGAEINRVVRSLLGVGENGRRPVRVSDVKPAPQNWKDIDTLSGTGISLDDAVIIHSNMPAFGIYSARRVPYAKACREGWAPPPTNAVQKAIWDKVHAIPSNPMKIKYKGKK